MFTHDDVKQFLRTAVVAFAESVVAQDTIILQELLTLFSITLDVLGELFDLPVVLLDLFNIDSHTIFTSLSLSENCNSISM